MKKLLLINMIAGLFLVSCDTEVKDLFDESASVRVQKAMDECFDLLTSAENGWVIEYYPDLGYGGYNYIAKFGDDGFVTVAFEFADDFSETVESHFSINASAAAVLTFDTYNEYIHYFSDPDPNGGATYGGDFEFTYISGNSREMEFKGTKSGNRIVFRALDTGEDWTVYLTEVAELEALIDEQFLAKFTYEGSDEVIFQATNYNTFVYADPDDPDSELEIAFIRTPDGIKFYEPVTVGGKQVQNFIWDDTAKEFTSTDEGATDIVLVGGYSDNFVPYDFYLGQWVFTYGIDGGGSGYTETVTLVENVRNESYYMTGSSIFHNYDIKVDWDRFEGHLTILQQSVGTYLNVYTIVICPWAGTSFWPTYTYLGMDLLYENRDEADPVLTFVDNGYVGAEGLFLAAFSGGWPGGTYAGSYDGNFVIPETLTRP